MATVKKPAPVSTADVIYPKVIVAVLQGSKALTADKMKEILGWEEFDKPVKDTCPELFHLIGKHVRLNRNLRNRPIYTSWLETLKQDHLNRRWRFNGEPIIIGNKASMLSGQHRGLSLILAEEERNSEKNGEHWKKIWPTQVTMECIVIHGIDEGDDTFKTINQGKTATGADGLYRSEWLKKYKHEERLVLARCLEFAVRNLWERIGYKSKEGFNAHSPTLTMGEMYDFIDHHRKVIDCVRHVCEEDKSEKGKGPVSQWLATGAAASMCYLMGTSTTSSENADKYRSAETPSEKHLDFGNWDRACEFWRELHNKGHKTLAGVRDAICEAASFRRYPALTPLEREDYRKNPNYFSDHGKLSRAERMSIITKGWLAFAGHHKVTMEGCELNDYKKEEDEDGREIRGAITDFPSCGGIDLANAHPDMPAIRAKEDDDFAEPTNANEEAQEHQDTPQEIEARKKTIREEKDKAIRDAAEKRKAKKATAEKPATSEPKSFADEINDLRSKAPSGAIMLHNGSGSNKVAWGEDAKLICQKVKSIPQTQSMGLAKCEILNAKVPGIITKMIDLGKQVVMVTDKGEIVPPAMVADIWPKPEEIEPLAAAPETPQDDVPEEVSESVGEQPEDESEAPKHRKPMPKKLA